MRHHFRFSQFPARGLTAVALSLAALTLTACSGCGNVLPQTALQSANAAAPLTATNGRRPMDSAGGPPFATASMSAARSTAPCPAVPADQYGLVASSQHGADRPTSCSVSPSDSAGGPPFGSTIQPTTDSAGSPPFSS